METGIIQGNMGVVCREKLRSLAGNMLQTLTFTNIPSAGVSQDAHR